MPEVNKLYKALIYFPGKWEKSKWASNICTSHYTPNLRVNFFVTLLLQ